MGDGEEGSGRRRGGCWGAAARDARELAGLSGLLRLWDSVSPNGCTYVMLLVLYKLCTATELFG